MPNYLLTVEYRGAAFCGWQKQPGVKSVQGEMERAAGEILREKVTVTAAGRTDKGVHALGQVVALYSECHIPPVKLRIAINSRVDKNISVKSARIVSKDFNPRYKASSKTYQYFIYNDPCRSTWLQDTSWQIGLPLNVSLMRHAGLCLLGKHDFTAFDASGSTQPNKIATMTDFRVVRKGNMVTLTFRADRFLYKMVRNLTGILVDIGLGRIPSSFLACILASRKRPSPVPTAPPHGLFLKKVYF